jgi:phosphatidylinositol alpha-1,6-mannosyltransferase
VPDKPRLLVITPDFPPAPGGIQLLIHRVVRQLNAFDVRVVTLASPGAARFDAGEPYPITRVSGHGRAGHRGRIARLNALAVAEAVRHRPSAVLAGHIVAGPAGAAIKTLLRSRFILYLHAKELGTKPALASAAVRRADINVVVSRHTERLTLAAGARPESIRQISPGVDLPSVAFIGARAKRPTILTVARLEDRHKGHDVMVRALPLIASRVPDVEWVIVGDGRLRQQTEQLVDALRVRPHVRFVGAVSDAERDGWLRRAHVFAMPSRLPGSGIGGEGFGIVYLEANAYGVPVVAGDVGGAVDAVVDGETATLVDPTDHVAVAGAITELLCDPERARAYGEAGARRALDFTWPRIGERLEQAILGALHR